MKRILEQLYWNKKCGTVGDDGAFLPFYSRFTETIIAGFSVYCEAKKLDVPELEDELIKAMTGQFRKISLRTLILEMNLADRCGELTGADEVEKYRCFALDRLTDNSFLREVYEVYPELYKELFRELERNVRNINSVLETFERDRKEINETFFSTNPCHAIMRIGGGSSDSHNGGKRVYWVALDNGERLVYKPRCLAIDKAFQRFTSYVSERVGVEYRWNAVLDKVEYGWCTWVYKKACETRKQLENYYFRNGLLLCVTYLLRAEDMHYENLIANGEYPVLVDLEMGLGSRGSRETIDGRDEINQVYRESVLHTGLLPLYAWNENGEGVNVGAINGSGGQLCPIMMPAVVEAGTVKMHIEYRQPVMVEGKNLATLNGRFIEPYEFLDQIQGGFEAAYRVIMKEKETVVGHLDEFSQVPVRYLVRETQQYAMMLNSSYHPKYLTAQAERQRGIHYMNRGAEDTQEGNTQDKKAWTCVQEETEMYRGDVPYFWYNANSRNLHSGTGEVYSDYFAQPIILWIKSRLQRMNEQDMVRQKQFIRNSLFIGTKKMDRERKVIEMCDIEKGEMVEVMTETGPGCDGLSVAERIGNILLEEAIWSEDGHRVGWISIVMAGYQERGYLMRPMGYYLYDGLAGVAVFMAGLVKKSQSDRYDSVYEALIRQLFAYTEKLVCEKNVQSLPTGAYTGEASVMYAYLLLYERTGEERFLQYLRKHSEIVARCLKNDRVYDVLAGNAGTVLVALRAYELTGERRYLNQAAEAGDELVKSATYYEWGIGWVNTGVGKALTGFAHGASGMILALCKLGYHTGNAVYHETAHKAFLFEQHYFMPEIGDWADLRFEDRMQAAGHPVWCHGRGGIKAAYSAAIYYAEPILRRELDEAIRKVDCVSKNRQGLAYCLCHGAMGNVGLLYATGEKTEARKQRAGIIKSMSMTDKDGLRKLMPLQECDNFGLMGGLCGIGYGCLEGEEMVMGLLVI